MKKRTSQITILLREILKESDQNLDNVEFKSFKVETTEFHFPVSILEKRRQEIQEILNSLDWTNNSIQLRFTTRSSGTLWTDHYDDVNCLVALGVCLNLVSIKNDINRVGRRALIQKNF